MLTVNDKRCTGCYACQNICPKNCITLEEDAEGFRYPKIDTAKCVDCHLCEGVCPLGQKLQDRNKETKPKTYASYSKDREVRLRSTTTGIAYLCGKHILEQGGVVFGVVGDVLHKVYHAKAVDLEELYPMRGSKYLQSEVGYTYREAKEELEAGKKVLFTGTPCQIAGLYGYLGKEYENLYTLDLICHGVPSEMVFRKYICELEEACGCRVAEFYRDKEVGWRPVHFSCVLADGRKIVQKGRENPFNHGFTTNVITRKSCQNCEYAQMPRVADISAGDYFAEDKSKRHDPANEGLAMIAINSPKGAELFREIEEELQSTEYPVEEVLREGEHLGKSPKRNVFRRTFFWMIRRHTFATTTKLLLPMNKLHKTIRRGYGVLCYIYEFFRKDSVMR